MALSSTRLRDSIIAKIQAISNWPETGESPLIVDTRLVQALAEAIVLEITGNAVTSTPGAATGPTTLPGTVS